VKARVFDKKNTLGYLGMEVMRGDEEERNWE